MRKLNTVLGYLAVATMIGWTGCGKDDASTSPSVPSQPSASSSSSSAGTNPIVSGGSCTAPGAAVGLQVFYLGVQGSGNFPDANASYLGKITQIFSDGSIQVKWDKITNPNVQNSGTIATQGICLPDITGKRVLYKGTQGATTANFPDSSANYFGTIVAVYAGGYADVKWDHLTDDVVVPFKSIATAIN